LSEHDSASDARAPGVGRFSRREFVAAGASALVVVGAAGILFGGQRGATLPSGPPPPLRFLREEEGKVITALAERIFPADDQSPGATDLRVTTYIDGQLASDWGNGARMYRQGPFETPADTGHGWQHDLTPSAAFRAGLAALDTHCQRAFGTSYDALDATHQDEVLTALSTGKVDTFEAPTAVEFFGLVRQSVLEGLFGDPQYGGNYGMGGWKFLGFPGDPMAYGDPYEKYIDNWMASYDVEPRSAY
jgi:gluconate 2-dehydrogenase gamma chain